MKKIIVNVLVGDCEFNSSFKLEFENISDAENAILILNKSVSVLDASIEE